MTSLKKKGAARETPEPEYDMKKIFCIIMVIVMALSLASCGGSAAEPEETAPAMSPTETVDSFLTAFKAGDFEGAKEFYEGSADDLSMIEEEDDPALSGVIADLTSRILDFDYELSNEVINGETATVDVRFTTIDFGQIMGEVLDSMLSDSVALALSGLSQDELEAEINELVESKFSEILKTAKKDKVSDVTVELVLKDGKWLIKDLSDSEEILDAISGGLIEFAESIGDTLS